ncbi:MAG: hypothetical protein MUF21_01105 [Gemmatimonadaceae bacterium]|jgi:DNA-directed RNA polymerase specialized sigma24 family protein|nr:hypothetical protein [Gemmatimonadaceae bacterium]
MALLPLLRALHGAHSPHADPRSIRYYDEAIDTLLPVCTRLLPRLGASGWTAEEIALDVAQDALLPLVRRAHAFAQEREVTAYLTHSACTLALRYAITGGGRDRIRLGAPGDLGSQVADRLVQPTHAVNPRDAAIRAAWDAALACLPAWLQELVRLRYESGATNGDIEAALGLSERSIRRYLSIVRPVLERALAPFMGATGQHAPALPAATPPVSLPARRVRRRIRGV